MKQLLNISTYKLTGELIGEIKEWNKKYSHSILPKYCLTEHGNILESIYYLQYIEQEKEEYRLFDVNHIDFLLNEEISNEGIDEIFKKYNFIKLFDCSCPINSEEYRRKIPNNFSIVIEVNYIGIGEDTDVDIYVLGYLDEKMNFIKI